MTAADGTPRAAVGRPPVSARLAAEPVRRSAADVLCQFGGPVLELGPPLCLADAEGRIRHANQRFRHLARSVDDADAAPWSRPRLAHAAAGVKPGGTAMEVVAVVCGGLRRRVFCRYMWLATDADSGPLLAAQFEDVTAEQAYRERASDLETRLADLSRLVSDWLWEVDENLDFTSVSPRILGALGWHPRQVIGRNLLSFGTFRSKPGAAAIRPDEFERRSAFYNLLLEVPAKSGRVHVFRLNGIPVFDAEDDSFRGFRGTARDVTEETEARAHAAISRAWLMEAIESFPPGFALFDEDDRLVVSNQAYRSMFSKAAGKPVANSSLLEFMARGFDAGDLKLPGGTYEDWVDRRRRLLNTGDENYEIALRDGRWMQVSDRRTTDGGSVTICTDVTELKAREAALDEARISAEVADRSKADFLATVSHELRTPLNAVMGFSDMMRNEILGPVDNPRYAEYVVDIHDSAQHLLTLINDILDVSKAEAGQLVLFEEEVDVAGLIAGAIKLVRGQAEPNRVEIVAAPGDPEACRPARIRADQRKLKQVLLNLLSNAVKFTPEGGRIEIVTGAGENGDFILEVSDTGIGIAEQDLAKVMIPFVQVDPGANRKFPGTGLGLPLSRALVELHGGRLEIESRLGRGTTVTVSLPGERILADPRAVSV